jgi:hypothetical protein
MLGTCRHASACSSHVTGFYAWRFGRRSLSRLYNETEKSREYYSLSLSLSPASRFFVLLLSSFPHFADYMHYHSGEQGSETLSIEILHREDGDIVFGEHLGTIARCGSSSFSLVRLLSRYI